ncbi:MAG: peptide chain release factor-like protein [Candidatus Omnitrophica bacterium]|nr:peptide chain release factor-like protein [Candidatus Omnitrophota bacterium]
MTIGHYPASPEKERALANMFERLGIREADIEERFIRAGGPGGQKVNKSSTCVYLKHRPSGIEVKCQQARSQALNRFLARRILAEKIDLIVRREHSAERQRIAKIRKQKRKRSKRAQEKILKNKKARSQKKTQRAFTPAAEDF